MEEFGSFSNLSIPGVKEVVYICFLYLLYLSMQESGALYN